MSVRRRSADRAPSPPAGAAHELAPPSRGVILRLAYGAVIAWIVAWFAFLLVQGVCPVP